jgi:hypothetical protein
LRTTDMTAMAEAIRNSSPAMNLHESIKSIIN